MLEEGQMKLIGKEKNCNEEGMDFVAHATGVE